MPFWWGCIATLAVLYCCVGPGWSCLECLVHMHSGVGVVWLAYVAWGCVGGRHVRLVVVEVFVLWCVC